MDMQQAIKNITYYSKKYPKAEFECISAHRDEAIPALREAVEKAVADPDGLEENYELHFYALFFLAEFQDREFFPKLIELVSLPYDDLEFLIGSDIVTGGMHDILYNTYNGDMELLKATAKNDAVNEFVRSCILNVMGQLYLDGELNQAEWKEFLKERVYSGEEYSYFYDDVAGMICDCHFVEMLPEVKYLYDNDLMDPMTLGGYDSCVDIMFEYKERKERFCKESVRAKDIKHWAMFEQENDEDSEALADAFEAKIRKEGLQAQSHKVGRNDPCPCGSGKKYKFCCLNKPKSHLDSIESNVERNKWLKCYPYVGDDRKEGRIYLQDYYDNEAIEIDKLLYLGLMNRPVYFLDRNEKEEENRCREYLKLAFDKFEEKILSDHIESFSAYDEKNSIHYFCADWVGRLLKMLDKSDEMYDRVKSCYKSMTK